MIRAYIYAAVLVSIVGALAWAGVSLYDAGADSVRVEWAAADAAAAQAGRLLARERAAAMARIDAAATAQARRVAADRAGAAAAGDGLRQRAAAVAARCDTGAASAGTAAGNPGAVLADVLGRLESAGRELAAVADERGVAGSACERAFDALSVRGNPPEIAR